VFPAPSFEPLATLKAIHEERCTAVYGTPTMFIDMLNHPEYPKTDCTSIRSGIVAGAPCPVMLCSKLVNEMGMKDLQVNYIVPTNFIFTSSTYNYYYSHICRSAMAPQKLPRFHLCQSSKTRLRIEFETLATLWIIWRRWWWIKKVVLFPEDSEANVSFHWIKFACILNPKFHHSAGSWLFRHVWLLGQQ
jgi:hypothetical protein